MNPKFLGFVKFLVRRCIKTAPKGKTKDLSGLRFEHLQQCIAHGGEFASGFLTLLFEQIARNPAAVSDMIAKARSVGIPKKKDDTLRPIGITSVFRRIWGKIILQLHGAEFEKILTSRNSQAVQLAVGVKGGAMQAGIYVNTLRDANPEYVHVQLDVKNAFNTLDRSRMLKAILELDTSTKERKEARLALLSFANAVYARRKSFLTFFVDDGPREFECSTGVTQGCGLGTLLFALTFQDVICGILEDDQRKSTREFEDVFVTAYADDAVVSGPPDQALAFTKLLGQKCRDEASLIKEHIAPLESPPTVDES